MFTGIIRELGVFTEASGAAPGRRLRLSCPAIRRGLDLGASVAINGVCLTVESLEGDGFWAFAGAETCARTTLGRMATGTRANLEPALRAGDELGGHIVTGHVDGIGVLTGVEQEEGTVRLRFSAPPELLADMAPRGSVAVDGISLTLTAVDAAAFAVAIIPYTWEHTNLAGLRRGDQVNIETDLIAKYVRRFLEAREGGITEDFLREHGYV
jgi:riboflavin synthase